MPAKLAKRMTVPATAKDEHRHAHLVRHGEGLAFNRFHLFGHDGEEEAAAGRAVLVEGAGTTACSREAAHACPSEAGIFVATIHGDTAEVV